MYEVSKDRLFWVMVDALLLVNAEAPNRYVNIAGSGRWS